MKYLLDTNVISELRNRERAHRHVAQWVAQTSVKEIGTSVLVLAEILRGIELKRRGDRKQAEVVDRWFTQMRTRLADRVRSADGPVAVARARLDIPHPPPLIDGLVAATAKVHGLTLVTRNVADMARAGMALFDPFST